MDIWNLPSQSIHKKIPLNDFYRALFKDKSVDALEIGVFHGSTLKILLESGVNISSYVGVDPYMGTDSDPY